MFPEAAVEIFDRIQYDGIAKKYYWGVCLQHKAGRALSFLIHCIDVCLCIHKLKQEKWQWFGLEHELWWAAFKIGHIWLRMKNCTIVLENSANILILPVK